MTNRRLCLQGRYGAAGVALEQRRRSPILEISLLLAECMQHGLRTIAFCKTRKVCELVTSYTRDVLRETAPMLASRLAVYRCACHACATCVTTSASHGAHHVFRPHKLIHGSMPATLAPYP